jgi:hypothetical protein
MLISFHFVTNVDFLIENVFNDNYRKAVIS